MTMPATERDTHPDGPLSGRTLGDYVVGRRLGRGGMGEVYLARQVSLDRDVALKVLPADADADPVALARFEAEAQAAARLSHPNIVHVYAVGHVEGVRFIAMEYVAGRTLRDRLRDDPPTIPAAVEIMRQAARALAAAGAAGLVHRDIKPDNLLLGPDGQVKVADFGLCLRPDSAAPLTRTGVTLGTPMYMSPEQVQGRALNHRSDLYSLGVTFYHLLAGRPPFRAENSVALALKHVHETPPPLQPLRPEAPPALVALVERLLEKDPARRPADAAEVVRVLDRVAHALGPATRPLPDDGATAVAPTFSSVLALPVEAPRPSHPHRLIPTWRWYLVGVPLALALGTLSAWLPVASPPPAAPPAPPGLSLLPWSDVPAQPDAAAQYRHAQTRAPASRRPAAWLAVPGRFPGDIEHVDLAYLQLVHDLFARGDAARLDRLADELDAARVRLEREAWEPIARLARAAAAARRDDAHGVLEPFRSWTNLALIDPAQAAVALEIVLAARRLPSAAGTSTVPLNRVRDQLLTALALDGPFIRQPLERAEPAP
jgi:serine/threonine-protein kinase